MCGSPGLAPTPGLVSQGAAASKAVKQAVGGLTGALAWTQSWAWPTGCVAGREWGLEAPREDNGEPGAWNLPVPVHRLAGDLHEVGLGPPRPSGPGEPLTQPGAWWMGNPQIPCLRCTKQSGWLEVEVTSGEPGSNL